MSTLKTDVLKDVAETVTVNTVDLPGAVNLRPDLASDTDAAKGAGLVGFDAVQEYPIGTVGDILKTISSSTQEVLATGATTARPLADQLGMVLTLRDFGAVGDGVADDSSAVQAALSSGRSPLVGEGLLYKVNSPLTMDSNTHLSDATFDFTAGPVDGHLFSAIGAETPSTLTASAIKGNVTVNVADGTLFATDDYVVIRSDDLWENLTNSTISEIARVKSIAGNVLTLYTPLLYTYSTADAAQCVKLQLKENITLSRITAKGGGAGLTQRAVLFDRCLNATVESCKFEDFEVASIRLGRCVKSSVSKVISSRNASSGTGYGVVIFDGSAWVNVSDCYFEDCRHGVAIGGTAGVNRYITVQGCHIYGARDAGLDSHPAGDYIVFMGNHSEQVAGMDGLVMQAANSVISNNTVIGSTRHGIFVQQSFLVDEVTTTITGNIIAHPSGGSGIAIYLLQQGTLSVVDPVISGNTIRDTWLNAIRVNAVSGAVYRAAITGNACSTPSAAGIFLSTTSGTIWFASITGNTIRGLAEQVYLSGGAASDVQYISVTGNACFGGTYGVRGVNTNRVATVGNILTGASVSGITVAGSITSSSGNITT